MNVVGRMPLWLMIGGPAVLGISLLAVMLWPHELEVQVISFSWKRTVHIDAWREVRESDWHLPNNATLAYTRSEVHHYEEVFSHYEYSTKEVCDTYTFDCLEEEDNQCEDVVCVDVEVKTAVYEDEPVYRTRYYYDIWKWIPNRQVVAENANHDPHWPVFSLASDERENSRSEEYRVLCRDEKKEYTVNLPFDKWESLWGGEKIKVQKNAFGMVWYKER